MKHIKSYKNKINKTYIIADTIMEDIPYYIFFLNNENDIKHNNNSYYIKYNKYVYYNTLRKNFIEENSKGETIINKDTIIQNILYKTNSYDDALTTLKTIINSTKYNL